MCVCVLICDVKSFQCESQSHLANGSHFAAFTLSKASFLFFPPIWLRFLINRLTLDFNPLCPHSVKAGLNTIVLNPGVFTNLQPNFQPLANTMTDLPIILVPFYLCEHHYFQEIYFSHL